MTKPDLDKQSNDTRFHVQEAAQKQKMDQASARHGKMRGDTEPNAGGQNREAGDRKARQNDRATNGGE